MPRRMRHAEGLKDSLAKKKRVEQEGAYASRVREPNRDKKSTDRVEAKRESTADHSQAQPSV
jgi:hypothetical protein